MTVDEDKAALRLRAKVQRKDAVAAAGDGVADKLAAFLLEHADDMGLSEGNVVAGYWALADEVDVIPAMTHVMEECGVRCALPVVAQNNEPLIFRAWQPGDELDSGGFGTHHPKADTEELTPDVLLVPLLAFDMTGYRMGWGGGFYDRTLEKLRRASNSICAVGVAYAGQEFDKVVRDRYDQPMDWIVTEKWAREIVGEAGAA